MHLMKESETEKTKIVTTELQSEFISAICPRYLDILYIQTDSLTIY